VRDFVVFYAWQNDTSPRENRYFIRTVLGLAAKRISDDPSTDVQVRIDSDTQGVLGQIPVAATILTKIDACDIFVPDFTFVAKTPRRKNKDGSVARSKRVTNPNVMLEYGYALKRLSYSAIVPIMNRAFGPPTELPFDMGHLKFPLQFRLEAGASGATRRSAAAALVAELEEILRGMIQAAKPKSTAVFDKAEAVRPPAFFFQAGETLAQYGSYESEREFYQFSATTAAFLRFFPSGAQEPVGRAILQGLFQARKIPPMGWNDSAPPVQNRYGSIIFDPIARSDMSALTQAFPSGELWGITRRCFARFTNQKLFEDGQEMNFVAMIDFERIFQKALRDYSEFATTQLGFKPPFTVIAGATGLQDFNLGYPSREYSGREYTKIHDPSFVKTYSLSNVSPHDLELVLRDFFERVWDLAACSRDKLLTDESIKVSGLIPRRTGED
jgi:hypothetical protein